MSIIDTIEDIIDRRGAEAYLGEPVSQAEHMLQSAMLAERAHASDTLVAAALLHDIGHFVSEFGEDYLDQGVDDQHEEAAARILEPWFPHRVVELIRLHVATKRYLCATHRDYFENLSDASVRSLALQGGPMAPDEVEAFEQNPFRDEAIRVRLWDEAAKRPGLATPSFAHYRPLLERLVRAEPAT